MWPTLLAEIGTRILAIRTHFAAVAGPKGGHVPVPPPAHEVTTKGLLFVQLYAVYEYSVRESVRTAITELKGSARPFSTFRLEFLALALDNHLQSASECGPENRWPNRINLFRMVGSGDPLDMPDDVFPHDGSHYRMGQLYTIWSLFGITAPVLPRDRLSPLIGELVSHRNAITHGRRTAEEVGGGFSRDDLHDRIDWTEEVCTYVVTTIQGHCSNPGNLAR